MGNGAGPRRLVPVCAALAAAGALAFRAVPPAARAQITAAPMDLATYYSFGEFEMVESALRRAASGNLDVVLAGLQADAEGWIDADGPDWAPGRRLIVATVALEAAHAGLDNQWRNSRDFIRWACLMLRAAPVTPAERHWHLAAIALIEGARDVGMLGDHIRHVRARFPDEPRLRLAEAFDDEAWYMDEVTSLGVEHGAGRRTSMYDDALAHPDSAREAHLRLGFMLLQGRQFDRAIAQLRQVEPPEDPGQQYLARLFEGWAHQRRDDPDMGEAERAFREAVEAVPGAYTVSLSLALLLYPTDRRLEADALMQAVADAEPPVVDPWRTYGYGDYRRWPVLLDELRRAIR